MFLIKYLIRIKNVMKCRWTLNKTLMLIAWYIYIYIYAASWIYKWIQNGFLVRRWTMLTSTQKKFQVVILDSERRNVLKVSHDIKTSGLLSVKKTLTRIRHMYFWPGWQRDVHQYIACCVASCRKKNPIPKCRAPMPILASGMPMEKFASDILCELPETETYSRRSRLFHDMDGGICSSKYGGGNYHRKIFRALSYQFRSRSPFRSGSSK